MSEITLEELEALAESGFTAGPWEFNVMRINSSHEDFPTIAMVHRRDINCSPEMTIANSKLITAAPSLLATAIAAKKREKELVEALSIMSGIVYEASEGKIMSVWSDHVDLRECVDEIVHALEVAKKSRALLKGIEQ